jgi:hypothetical protein
MTTGDYCTRGVRRWAPPVGGGDNKYSISIITNPILPYVGMLDTGNDNALKRIAIILPKTIYLTVIFHDLMLFFMQISLRQWPRTRYSYCWSIHCRHTAKPITIMKFNSL